jgi:hypothetical protein
MLTLLPSLKKIKTFENKLKTLVKISNLDGITVSLKEYLKKIMEFKELVEAMDLSDNTLQLKIGRDRFYLNRYQNCLNFYFILFNLELLVHSPEYVFTLGSFLADKSWETIQRNLQETIEEMKQL